jgi:hypothetical protein
MPASRLHLDPPALRAGAASGRALPVKARPFVLGLLLLVLLFAFCNVVQGSVERGQQLNRQMAGLATACQPRAGRTVAPRCSQLAANESAMPDRQQPKLSAAR